MIVFKTEENLFICKKYRMYKWTKFKLLQNCVKNDTCDVIKMRKMRGEVGKKTSKKEMENPSYLLRHRNQKWYRLGFVLHAL